MVAAFYIAGKGVGIEPASTRGCGTRHAEALLCKEDGSTHLVGTLLEHRTYIALGFTYNSRNTGLDDTRLFASNSGVVVTQQRYVVEADVGDNAHIGGDDIGGVQSATQAHLDNGHIDLL